MKGFLYIASAFKTVNRSKCGQGGNWIDNDPHFWSDPPTWGICRPDLRKKADIGDYIFYTLPKSSKHPQMIFAYMKIKEIISHVEAFHRVDLRQKRMREAIPNGNIIVDAKGEYNKYDRGAHRNNFIKISQRYVIGDISNFHFLTDKEINRKSKSFLNILNDILDLEFKIGESTRAVDLISRYGRTINADQIEQLVSWCIF